MPHVGRPHGLHARPSQPVQPRTQLAARLPAQRWPKLGNQRRNTLVALAQHRRRPLRLLPVRGLAPLRAAVMRLLPGRRLPVGSIAQWPLTPPAAAAWHGVHTLGGSPLLAISSEIGSAPNLWGGPLGANVVLERLGVRIGERLRARKALSPHLPRKEQASGGYARAMFGRWVVGGAV